MQNKSFFIIENETEKKIPVSLSVPLKNIAVPDSWEMIFFQLKFHFHHHTTSQIFAKNLTFAGSCELPHRKLMSKPNENTICKVAFKYG